ncbi:hypothetical protein [Salinigranum halophilum]|uniref:hypothetical protein n=1 Tax=Salinigranum halophilum TaxID=2565931 RepID=UPI0010A852EF|nr:hypothetical protein [Salinigranum halophilum]
MGVLGSAVLLTGSGTVTAKPGVGNNEKFDPTLVNVVNVADAEEPTLRLDNENGVSVQVQIHSTGASDGAVYTVGANQAGFKGKDDGKPNATGKLVPAECGEVITDVKTKRPSGDTWVASGFSGTATVGGAGCP